MIPLRRAPATRVRIVTSSEPDEDSGRGHGTFTTHMKLEWNIEPQVRLYKDGKAKAARYPGMSHYALRKTSEWRLVRDAHAQEVG